MDISDANLTELSRKKLSQTVFEVLQDRIVAGKLKPGTLLVEEAIARELGTSRSPVRQAIARLQEKGFAEWADKRVRRVLLPSKKTASDLFDTCAIIEWERIYRSNVNAPQRDLDELAQCLDELAALRERNDTRKYARLSYKLREILVRRCDNEKLNELSRELEMHQRWLISLCYPSDERRLESEDEHRLIAEKYIQRDIQGLEAATRAHLERQREQLIELFESSAVKAPGEKSKSGT